EALTVYEDVLRLDPTCLAAYQGQARVLKKIALLAYEKLNPSTVQPSESRKPQDDAQEGRK
ncbi:MAG: hypothetical protein J2P36_25045, partial [Ktedonobacteraceae bacterium]|nr:hypothetical protein [Ktedonobacteraceae bacterium]